MADMQEKKSANVKRILETLVEYKKVKDIQELNEFLELPKNTLYTWIKRNKIAKPLKILGKMPELNEEWLETGEGPMLAREETPEEKLVRTYGKNPVIKNIAAAWENEGKQALQIKEEAKEYQTVTMSKARQEVITQMETVLSFLEDTYHGFPHHMDIIVADIKGYLRQGYETYRGWEADQDKKFMETQKKQGGEGDQDGSMDIKTASGN